MANYRRQFSKIYDKNVEKIYRFIFLKVGQKEVCEDLTSTVFSKSWHRFKSGQQIDNHSAYLYQVARAEIANYYRWLNQAKVVSTENKQIVDPSADLEAIHQKESELTNLRIKLASLNEEQQNLIIWRHLDGMSIKQISQMADKSPGAVRVQLHRALKELKGLMV